MLDRAISPRLAVVLVAVVGGTAWWLSTDAEKPGAFGAALWRVSAFAILLLGVGLVAIDNGRAYWTRWRTARAQARQTAPTAPRGIRRLDFYIAVLLIVGALLYLAQANRYTVTYLRDGQRVAYQRTDRLTGTVELWVAGTDTPTPAWLRVHIPQQ
ncbi:MAG TPA: hypothetical protein VM364_05845 [Vicinamibacterales bacterium]|nr:hypothetical protein [Vicinamibacterales bacterium]